MTSGAAIPRLNLLVAYPYVTDRLLLNLARIGDGCRFLLDSGAFTAWKAGKPIKLEDYCRFVEALPIKPWRYLALDVIGDPAATRRQYLAMLDRGLRPVPVFTRGEDPAELDRLYETSDVVALGGVAGADRAAYAWVKWITPHLRGRKAHILGFTGMDWVKHLRPYSVDSSTWEQCSRYGRMDVYLGQGRFCQIQRKAVGRMPRNVAAAIERLGYDPAGLLSPDAWSGGGSLSVRVAVASWLTCSRDVERNLGTMLFLAAEGNRAGYLFEAHSAYAARFAEQRKPPTP